MSKWICIEETSYLTLHHHKTGSLCFDVHKPGDIVEVENGFIRFIDEDGELYIGSLGPDQNHYDGAYHNQPELEQSFIPFAEWRNRQIDSILND